MNKRLNKVTQNQKQDKLRELHHAWAKGFINPKTKTRDFHPYTRLDFKFDCEK